MPSTNVDSCVNCALIYVSVIFHISNLSVEHLLSVFIYETVEFSFWRENWEIAFSKKKESYIKTRETE